MKGKFLPLLCATLVCGAAMTTQAVMVHESDFDETTGTNPVTAGDVSVAHATGGGIFGHGNGYYHYPGDGTFLLHHPAHEWDDSMLELDTSGMVGSSSPVEYVFEFDTNVIGTAGANATVEILLTEVGQDLSDPGVNYTNAKANADAIFWFQMDGGSACYVGFGPGNANPSLSAVSETADNINDVKVIINHDGTDWRAFYQINGGSLLEAANSPMAAARTTEGFRVECDNTPWAPTMDDWELVAKNLQVYDTVETTAAVLAPGEVLKLSDFNEPAGSVGTNGHFYPIPIDVNGLFIDTGAGATHEYDGTSWVVGHDGDQSDNWNATITTIEDGSEDAEWVLDIKPNYPNDGQYQMFNFKIDGAGGSMYVANDTGNSGNIYIIFGE